MASLKPGVLKCFGEEPPGGVASSQWGWEVRLKRRKKVVMWQCQNLNVLVLVSTGCVNTSAKGSSLSCDWGRSAPPWIIRGPNPLLSPNRLLLLGGTARSQLPLPLSLPGVGCLIGSQVGLRLTYGFYKKFRTVTSLPGLPKKNCILTGPGNLHFNKLSAYIWWIEMSQKHRFMRIITLKNILFYLVFISNKTHATNLKISKMKCSAS